MADLQEGGSGENIWSRRNLLGVGGWLLILGAFQAAAAALVALLFPRVLFEPPTAFKAGPPSAYRVGEVSDKWQKDQRIWIIRNDDGLYALIAICTHLGCTPRWLEAEDKFKCPCHGSGFHRDGTNFEGPAPRPLERAKIVRADDGQLLIDKAVKFRKEYGDWGKPGSFFKYSATATS
jgi:cytochrome b6-f complex iron-sulfur subunit